MTLEPTGNPCLPASGILSHRKGHYLLRKAESNLVEDTQLCRSNPSNLEGKRIWQIAQDTNKKNILACSPVPHSGSSCGSIWTTPIKQRSISVHFRLRNYNALGMQQSLPRTNFFQPSLRSTLMSAPQGAPHQGLEEIGKSEHSPGTNSAIYKKAYNNNYNQRGGNCRATISAKTTIKIITTTTDV